MSFGSWPVFWGSGSGLIHSPLFLLGKIALELKLFRTQTAFRNELNLSSEVGLNNNNNDNDNRIYYRYMEAGIQGA